LSHLATNPDGILDALDHSHPLAKALGIYLSKKHQQMMTEEKSLEISFSEFVCVAAQPSSTGSRKCRKGQRRAKHRHSLICDTDSRVLRFILHTALGKGAPVWSAESGPERGFPTFEIETMIQAGMDVVAPSLPGHPFHLTVSTTYPMVDSMQDKFL
jgi:hypothetical protein